MPSIKQVLQNKINTLNAIIPKDDNLVTFKQKQYILKKAAFYAYIDTRYNNQEISGKQAYAAALYLQVYVKVKSSWQKVHDSNATLQKIITQKEEKSGIDFYNLMLSLIDDFDTVLKALKLSENYLTKYHFSSKLNGFADPIFELMQPKIDFTFPDLFDENGDPITKQKVWQTERKKTSDHESSDFEEDFNDISDMLEDEQENLNAKQLYAIQNSEEYKAQANISAEVFIEYFAILDSNSYSAFDNAYDIALSLEESNCGFFKLNQLNDFIKSFDILSEIDMSLADHLDSMDNLDFDSLDELQEITNIANKFINIYQGVITNFSQFLLSTHKNAKPVNKKLNELS